MPEFPGTITPNPETRAGRMLEQGQVTATVKSHATGEHITVRLKAMLDNRDGKREGKRWLRVPLREASHVFIDVPSAGGGWPDKIGTFYPNGGRFFEDRNADPARVWAAAAVALWINGREFPDCTIQEESLCGMCGKELTDPESIQRGIGPVCYGRLTGSKHQAKVKAQQELVVDAE